MWVWPSLAAVPGEEKMKDTPTSWHPLPMPRASCKSWYKVHPSLGPGLPLNLPQETSSRC